MMSIGIIRLVIVFILFSTALSAQDKNHSGMLLEVGHFADKTEKQSSQNEIKIVSYNMRWRGGDDLKKLIELFRTDKEIGGASIIGLQEVDRNKKRTRNKNTVKAMAQSLNMNYVWAAPPNPKGKERGEEETGVAILSVFPLSDVTRIVLPNEGPGGRSRVAIGATVTIGELKIRVYSVHAETRITSDEKLEQIQAPIVDLHKYHNYIERAVVLGDFNTITAEEVEKTNLFYVDNGFSTPFPNDQTTWKQFFIKLKLDWLWLLGFQVKEYGIDKKITFSDHFPLWVNAKLLQENVGGK